MSDIENDTIDPIIELENAKEKISREIAATKNTLRHQNKEMAKLEKLELELIPDKLERIQDKQTQIDKLNEKLAELEVDLKALNRTRDDENEEKIQAALNAVARNWLDKQPSSAYVIQDQEFVTINNYSESEEKLNVQLMRYTPKQFVELVSKELKLKSWHLPIIRLVDVFNSENRTFDISRFSIDDKLWKGNKVYLPIKHMEKYFIDKVDTTDVSDDCIQYFEWLMYSLSGGKKENQDHIEKWLLHKVKNYRKSVTTPDLVIVGHVGGNGKGILQAIVRMMFPNQLSGKANAKTLNGNFNAIMMGKLVVFFDDQISREIPLEMVKQLAGSDTMIFEPKGKDQYEGEKTHSSAWFSNVLPFKLTPGGQEGGVDRRFSIMRTNITFLESIRINAKKELEVDISIEASKDWAEVIVGNILLNRLNIAKWFKFLDMRHPGIDEKYTLKPLHGEDYHYFLDQQQTSIETIWDKLVVPQIKRGSCVPTFVISKLIEYLDSKPIANNKLRKQIEELITTTKLDVIIERAGSLEIHPSKMNKGKQCNIIRPKQDSDFYDRTFNWGLVSNQHFSDILGPNERLFTDDNCIFGQTSIVGDEDDEDLDFFEK
jgi:phage/plasmid-associated DNA primase